MSQRFLSTKIKHGCGVFNGVDATLTTPIGAGISTVNGITIECWARVDDTNDQQILFSTGQNPDNRFYMGRNNGNWQSGVGSKTWSNAPTIAPVVVGEWIHLCMSITGRVATLYANGVYIGTKTSNNDITLVNNLTIGSHGGQSYIFCGKIDELRIWNYARTAEQIKNNYNKVVKPQSGLIGYYKLDGNGLDSSGNNAHATINGGMSWSVDGRVNDVSQVAEFDGAGQINTTAIPTVGKAGTFSIETFAYFTDVTANNALIHSGFGLVDDRVGLNIASSVLRFGYYDGTWYGVSSNTLMQNNKFYHILAVKNGTTVELYINGVKQTGTDTPYAHTQNNFIIGNTSATGYGMKGRISYVRVWGKILTVAESQANMFKVLPSNTTGLIEQWTLNGHALGAKGNNGILIGGVKFTPDIPTIKADVSTTLEKQRALTTKKERVGRVSFNDVYKQYIRTDYTPNICKDDFSVEMMVSCTKASGNNVLMVQGDTAGTVQFWWFGINANRLVFTVNNVTYYSNTVTLTDGVIRHIAMVRSAGVVTFYVNKVAQGTASTTANADSVNNVLPEVRFGSFGNSNSSFSNATMRYARAWNRALTTSELNENRDRSITGTGLLLEYKMNEGSGTVTRGTLGSTGTLSSYVSNDGMWLTDVAGYEKLLVSRDKQPYEFSFNAGNNAVSYGLIPALDNTVSMSIGFWCKLGTTARIDYLINKRGTGSAGFSLVRDSSNRLSTIYRTPTTMNQVFWDIPANTLGQYMYVAYTFNEATKTNQAYINGVPLTVNTGAAVITDIPKQDANAPFTIGAYHDGVTNPIYTCIGSITSVRYWTAALSQEELLKEMLSDKPVRLNAFIDQFYPTSNLVATSLNNRAGSYTGTTTSTLKTLPSTAPVGQRSGLRFNASNNYATISSIENQAPFGNNPHTLEAWVYPLAYTNDYNYIISIGSGTNTTGRQSSIGFRGTGKVFQSAYTSPVIEFNYILPLKQWTHLSISHSNGASTLIVNGVTLQTLNIALNPTNTKVNIGAHTMNLSNTDSIISNVRIWDKALNNVETKANMHRYLPATTPNLVEQWRLNEGAGSVVYGTKGNNGTITGTATWTTPSLMNYVGKHIITTGGNNGFYASTPIRGNENYTIELWYRNINVNGNNFHFMLGVENSLTSSLVYVSESDSAYNIDFHGIRVAVSGVTLYSKDWVHLAVVKNGDTGYFYRNGVLATTVSSLPARNITSIFRGFSSTAGSYQSLGAMDEVRLWNVARTQTQIQENMNRTLGRESGLVLNMGFESDYYDASGYGNHGTPVGSPVLEVTDNPNLLLNAPINPE
jgi:hypothetical protein